MIETLSGTIDGHLRIKCFDTGEILVDKDNAVHFGNISTEIAQALAGDTNSVIRYMAFGNGGVIIDGSGNIVYRKPDTSLEKTHAQLWNTTLIIGDPPMDLSIPGGNTRNFEDIVINVILPAGFPAEQENIDQATGSNDQNIANTTTNFVFNELALYTGPVGESLDINTFVVNPSNVLITHVIFHPVQKSLNRTLEITYTLRIQMGD